MKKIKALGLVGVLTIAILSSGCSNSALDKRNKYDFCVTDWLKKNGFDFIGYNGAADAKAQSACNFILE